MDFIKRQAFFIVCAAVAVGGIALGAVGYNGMSEIMTEMKTAEGIFQNLQNAQSGAANQSHIEAEQARIRAIQEDRDRVMQEAAKLMPYEQLVPDFFPLMIKEKEDQFREKYVEKLNSMLDSLQYGTPADDADVAKMKERMKREEFERNKDRLTADPADGPPPPPPPSGPAFSAGMVLTDAGARNDAVARAHMNKAQTIRCYAVGFTDKVQEGATYTLQLEKSVPPTGRMADRPAIEALWRAQVGLWIQEDVIEAIRKVNDTAAEAYRAAHAESEDRRPPWVGVMPVKEVISIRLSDYVFPTDAPQHVPGDVAGGFDASDPLGLVGASFTGAASNEWFEVIHFNVKLIMDERDIPAFITELCKDRFHTLLRMSYKTVPPDGRMRGKIYGDEPVVNVVFDFETIMLGEKFRRMMPDLILVDYLRLSRPGEEMLADDGG